MESLQLIVTLLASAGFLGGITALVKVILDHRRGVRADETTNEQRHIERIEADNARLRALLAGQDDHRWSTRHHE